jgi:hypothetical protein
LQLRQDFSDLAPALPLVVAIITVGQAAQMGYEGIPIGQTVGADAVGNAGGHDLLGSAPTDAKQKFQGRPVDERTGEGLKLPNDIVDLAARRVLRARGYFTMLVRTCAKYNFLERMKCYPSFVIEFRDAP